MFKQIIPVLAWNFPKVLFHTHYIQTWVKADLILVCHLFPAKNPNFNSVATEREKSEYWETVSAGDINYLLIAQPSSHVFWSPIELHVFLHLNLMKISPLWYCSLLLFSTLHIISWFVSHIWGLFIMSMLSSASSTRMSVSPLLPH